MNEPFSLLDLKSARVTLVSALVWRAITELVRRHHPVADFSLRQIHPGISIRGLLELQAIKRSDRTASTIVFSLGGVSGAWEAALSERQSIGNLLTLLESQPERAIDAMQEALGLPACVGTLPKSSPQVVTLRVLTGLLEQRVFDPMPWRITLGVIGWSEDISCDWAGLFFPEEPLPKRPDAAWWRKLSDVALLHPSFEEGAIQQRAELGKAKALAVRLSDGNAFVVDATSARSLPPIDSLYAINNRCVDSAIGEVRKLMG